MTAFDPYETWLGIAPDERPPTHYRLLGLRDYESDPEVLRTVADQTIAYVRRMSAGPHAALARSLLDQLAAARACLTDPATKAAYDRTLRSSPPPLLAGEAASPVIAAASGGPRRARSGSLWVLAGGVVAGGLAAVGLSFALTGGWTRDNGPKAEIPAASGGSPERDGDAGVQPLPQVEPARGVEPIAAAGDAPHRETSPRDDPGANDPPPQDDPPDAAEATAATPPSTPPRPEEVAAAPADVPLSPARPPIPEETARQQAETRLQAIVAGKSEATPADKLALANELMSLVERSGDDLPLQYAALTRAQALAADAGHGEAAMKASGMIADRFDISPVEAKEPVAKALGRLTRTPAQARDVALLYILLVKESLARNEFSTAERMADGALEFATRTRYAPFREQMQQLVADVKAMHGAYIAVREARETLQQDPDAAEASLRWGRFLCFEKGDWPAGLGVLAGGGADPLAALARRALMSAVDGPAMEQLADDWWAVGEGEKGIARRHVLEHAVDWYERALDHLDPLQRPAVEQKAARIFGDARIWECSVNGGGTVLGGQAANVGPTFTLEFWVRTRADAGMLLCKRHLNGDGGISVRLDGGRPVVWAHAPEYQVTGRADVPINDGRWHHVALSKLLNDVQMYVDGEPAALIRTRERFSSRSPWVLGAYGVDGGQTLDARFCGIRLSSVARYYAPFEPERTFSRDKFAMLLE